MATQEERSGRSFNVRLGHQTTSWSVIESTSNGKEDSSSETRAEQRQAIRTFLHQKPHRVHQRILIRRIVYVILTSLAMLGAWAIGYYGVSVFALVGVVIVVIVVWTDQSKKLASMTEQEIEMKVRRMKTVQLSESAEWVNLAINRWWMTCSDSIIGFLKDYIEPLLQEVIPPGVDHLELVEFDLANQTPFVKSIQIFEPPISSSTRNSNPVSGFTNPGSSSKVVLVANIDVGLIAPDSKLTMKVRVGGKKIGYDSVVYVEGLHLSGNMQAIIHIDYDAPFPHIACISATFTRKPDLWFSVRVMKGLKVTDIPLVKTWVHSFVMNIFQSLLVDPGRLEIDLMSSNPTSIADPNSSRRARGVLTVKFDGSPPEKPSKYENDLRRWVTFKLGHQKHQIQLPIGKDSWKVTHSFLVYDLKQDEIVIKIKHRRIMYTMELAHHTIPLTVLGLLADDGTETEGTKTMFFHNTESNIGVDMEYSLLQPFSLNAPVSLPPVRQVAGVLYIHVHSASDLISSDVDGLSDPYCVVLANKTKLMTTHYVLDTVNPKWERGAEVFVRDFTQTSLTFLVYDWDGPLAGDDFLGSAKLNLTINDAQVLQHTLDLEIDGNTNKKGRSLGKVTVSVVFRSVESVAKSESIGGRQDMVLASGHQQYSGSPNNQSSSSASRRGSKYTSKRLSLQPSLNYGVLEVSIVAGRDLVGMDRNGLSDPYIVVKYGSMEVCRTPHVDKTLNPQWNRNYTLSAPAPDVSIVFECWDKDQFSRDDFMGSLAFLSSNLQMFENGQKWCSLDHVRSGQILLELKKQEPSEQQAQDSLSSGDLSTLDEASKHLRENQNNASAASDDSVSFPSIRNTPPSRTESTDHLSIPKKSISSSSPNLTGTPPPPHPQSSTPFHLNTTTDEKGSPLEEERKPSILRNRRSSSNYGSFGGSCNSSLSGQSGTLSATIPGADIQSRSKSRRNRNSDCLSESNFPLSTVFYRDVHGEIVEVNGLKGKLEDLELYIKLRLNSHPSHLRTQKFDRGSNVHKTRKLRGAAILKWSEPFTVKESPIPSDSLLTIDLKSGPNVTLGSHVITLDRLFDGNITAMKWLDLGNSMKVMICLKRSPPTNRSLDIAITNGK